MPQSKKPTPSMAPSSRGSRSMSEGPKSTARRPAAARAMEDKTKGTDKGQKTQAKTQRARRSDNQSNK